MLAVAGALALDEAEAASGAASASGDEAVALPGTVEGAGGVDATLPVPS